MCGIAGVLSSTHLSHEDGVSIRKMADQIRHRGPDGEGLWTDTEHGVALAHRRLSIVDLSSNGSQPMISSNERYVLTFNGEVYNHRQIRKTLNEQTRIDWVGSSDTEVLLQAIQNWGVEKTLTEVTGMFVFCLYDRKSRRACFARDRFGEKPLYMARPTTDSLIFGSELRAIEAHHAFDGTLCGDAVCNLVHYRYISSPNSIYKNVVKLPPASLLWVDLEKLQNLPRDVELLQTATTYWSVGQQFQSMADLNSYTDAEEGLTAVTEALKESIDMQLQADVPVGVFLSGGIDSSTVSAIACEVSSHPVKTFTIGVKDDEDLNEAHDAKRVADHLGTDHTELYLSADNSIQTVMELSDIYDEPFADPSQIPTSILCKMAREHVTVCLSGDGGDEMFGGYNRHVWAHESWPKLSKFPLPLRKLSGSLLTRPREETWDTVFRKLVKVLPSIESMQSPGQKIHKLAKAISSKDGGRAYQLLRSYQNDASLTEADPGDLINKPHSRFSSLKSDSLANQFMLWDMQDYLPEDILTKVDRSSMSVGLEVRVPFLDINLSRLAMQIPIDQKISGSKGKQLLREILYKRVPKDIIDRPKSGFGIPIDEWLTSGLKDWAGDLLFSTTCTQDPFLNGSRVDKLWEQHQSGERKNGHAMWPILSYLAWKQSATGRDSA